MKIVRIIARLNMGGPARHVVWLTAGLPSPEFQTVLVTGVVPPGEEDMSYFAADHGVEPVVIQQMSRELSPLDLITLWKVYRLLCRERPDVVHTHTAKAGTMGRVAGTAYRWLTWRTLTGRPRPVKFVHTYHGHVFHGYYGKAKTGVFLFIERLLARLSTDRFLVLSPQQLAEINQTFRVGRANQFAVVPLGLDLSAFDRWADRRSVLRDELGAGKTEILVGIVGRLTEVKQHSLFLNVAASYLKQQRTHAVRFVIIGDGQLRPELEGQAKTLGLDEEMVFLGARDDPENFYPALDIVALTSRNEGTPLTLIEAMANARPVIATAVGGVVDLLGDADETEPEHAGYQLCRNGILVEPDNPDAFAAGLAELIERPDLRGRLGYAGWEFVQEKFKLPRLLNDIANLYRTL